MFTGEEEVFAFQRTVSRLTEMQTEQYWKDGDRSKKKVTIKNWMNSPRSESAELESFLAQLK